MGGGGGEGLAGGLAVGGWRLIGWRLGDHVVSGRAGSRRWVVRDSWVVGASQMAVW